MNYKEINSPVIGARAFISKNHAVSVIVAHEPCGPAGQNRWHMSIAARKRYPHWDEIREARYELIPHEAMMAMMLPPPDQYVNVHEWCFHLFEIEKEDIPRYAE